MGPEKSSEIEQKGYGWKKAALRFALENKPEKIRTIKGKPEKILKLFRDLEKDPKYRIISLEKTPTFRDILRETCHFGPMKKDGDN